jgi:peptidoglycan/xylan/chitin deacetylase (PgdA/CDA1 family)
VSETGWRLSPFLRASVGLHAAGAAALVFAPERWPLIVGGLLLDHAVIGAGVVWPRSTFLGPNLTRLPAASGEVALTFDDGPHPEVTPAVLDLLDRRGARATFFCIGRKVAAHPDLAAEIHRRGHRIENHTYSHPNAFGLYGSLAMEREIRAAQDAIAAATGRAPRLFRAPVGIRNPWLDRVLARNGLRLVSWTRRGLDTVGTDVARISRRLLAGLAAGDILLLHDGSSARDGAGRAVALDALDVVLDGLAAAGLRSVTLDGVTALGAR